MAQCKGKLTVDKQILHLVQWFAEFSEFQKQDFLIDHLNPIAGTFLRNAIFNFNQNNGNAENDLENNIQTQVLSQQISLLEIDTTRPPSIFQCRMKLLKEWFQEWSDQDRIEFLLRLKNVDSNFVILFYRFVMKQNKIESKHHLTELLLPDEARKQLADRLGLFNDFVWIESNQEPTREYSNENGSTTVEQTKPDLLIDCSNELLDNQNEFLQHQQHEDEIDLINPDLRASSETSAAPPDLLA